MGWGDPLVIASLVGGVLLLIAFPFIESRVKNPMLRMDLFTIRNFAYGNASSVFSPPLPGRGDGCPHHPAAGHLAAAAWLQFRVDAVLAGVYMLPLTIGFVIMGPLSGIFSDKYGARWISTIGMVLVGVSFLILAVLPYNFDYLPFAIALLIMGLGNGMFSSPNAAAIMNSVPPEERGVTSGMMSTLMNSGFVLSMGMFFTIIVFGLTREFPHALSGALTSAGRSSWSPR